MKTFRTKESQLEELARLEAEALERADLIQTYEQNINRHGIKQIHDNIFASLDRGEQATREFRERYLR